ncbi:MAG: metallopeptidase family protein [Chlorobi bacterium]|nr:metallopeptidase family protein [Chlorobiota bacterium]MCI0715008.1 metallopeptidase family protein [Chlorobiota bacterium]
MISVSEEEFQQLMDESIENIPELFKDKIENLAFIVEPYPSESDLGKVGLKEKHSLLGLYSGVPYTHRTTWYTGVTPDRIILFQRNIEALCNSIEQLKEKIREVVIHEVAHYFGMNEDEIRKAGY